MSKLKFCGISTEEDLNLLKNEKVDYVGFIFYRKSKRYVNPDNAMWIKRFTGIKKVGVFVNESIQIVKNIFTKLNLDIVQYHGDENYDFCNEVNLPFWKVIRVKDENSFINLDKYNTDTFLLETFKDNVFGGTGETFNYEIIPKKLMVKYKFMIAGGLNEENVSKAISLEPYGIDINSGVELYPGKKDKVKIDKILNKIKLIEKNNGF